MEEGSLRTPLVPGVIDVLFTLKLDKAIGGLEFVRLFGFNPKDWSYSGQAMTGPLKRQFKLVVMEDCVSLEDIRRKLVSIGNIPQGQWLHPFRLAYPHNDRKSPIGIADPSWVGPGGHALFPALHQRNNTWRLDFDWSQYDRVHSRHTWRWLIEV